MSCQWISVTKDFVTYHTIVTFHGTWSLVILILFTLVNVFPHILWSLVPSAQTLRCLPMICDTTERLVTIFTSCLTTTFVLCVVEWWDLSHLVVACKSALSCSHGDSDWELCLPLSVCLIFALDCLTSSVLWTFGWQRECSLTFSVSTVVPNVGFCLPVQSFCLVADFELSLTLFFCLCCYWPYLIYFFVIVLFLFYSVEMMQCAGAD